MTDVMEPLRVGQFPDLVEQTVTLLSQSRKAFLLGAGCSKCAGLPLAAELTKGVLKRSTNLETKRLLDSVAAQFEGADPLTITIEDYLSEMVDQLSIVERRENALAKNVIVTIEKERFTPKQIRDAIDDIKANIAACINEVDPQIDRHTEMMRAIHRVLPAGKGNATSTVDYFVLNYDTLVEDALGLERVSHVDGFKGGATGWWTAGAYDAPAEARVIKLHGSIDWCLLDGDVFPRRIRPCIEKSQKHHERVLIWPCSTKHRETQRDPYAQMMDLFRASILPNDGSELVLAVLGYRFYDSHINLELERALRESDGRLTLLAFISDAAPTGPLKKWSEDARIRSQIRVHADKGFFHAGTAVTSLESLPWWRFEVMAKLLRGQR